MMQLDKRQPASVQTVTYKLYKLIKFALLSLFCCCVCECVVTKKNDDIGRYFTSYCSIHCCEMGFCRQQHTYCLWLLCEVYYYIMLMVIV